MIKDEILFSDISHIKYKYIINCFCLEIYICYIIYYKIILIIREIKIKNVDFFYLIAFIHSI